MIELPKNVAHLGAAVRQHRELLKLLKATGTRLGGGTVLAAHWGEHRRSTELDLMMKAAAFDEHQETIRQMLAEIPANEHSAIVDKTTKRRIVLAARGINGLTGDIEIVRDQLGDSMRTAQGTVEGPRVWDVAMNAEATVYILAKKLNRLERRDLERDHYDLLWGGIQGPRGTHSGRNPVQHAAEAVQTTALRAQTDPAELFKNEKKQVLDPKAPGWKAVLATVWQAIDAFTTEPGRTRMKLPKLRGAGGKETPTHWD